MSRRRPCLCAYPKWNKRNSTQEPPQGVRFGKTRLRAMFARAASLVLALALAFAPSIMGEGLDKITWTVDDPIANWNWFFNVSVPQDMSDLTSPSPFIPHVA